MQKDVHSKDQKSLESFIRKIQQLAEKYLLEKTVTYQKRYSTSKDKEETTMRWVRGVYSQYNQVPHTPGLATHKLENNYITEVLP